MKRYLKIVAMALALLLALSTSVMAEVTDPTTPPTSTDPTTPPTTDTPDAPEPTPHVHNYRYDNTVVPADCVHGGIDEYVCDGCGDQELRDTAPTGKHDYKYDNTVVPADCGNGGIDEYICSVCGDQILKDSDPTGEHQYEVIDELVAPTCTDMGLNEVKCRVCGDQNTLDVPALGHKFGDWKVTKPAAAGVEGEKQRECSVCKAVEKETIPALEPDPTKKPSHSKPSTAEQPVSEDEPALPYGSIVTDVAREAEEYEAEIVEEKIEGSEDVNHVLVITAEPDEGGAYVLRNLHITDELLAKMAEEHIEIVRFVVGTATVEFPVASFTGDVMAAIKEGLASPAKEFIVTVDPTATTEEGNPGCSVSASIACEDASEFDVTAVVEGLTVTMNGVAQPVTEAAVYAA